MRTQALATIFNEDKVVGPAEGLIASKVHGTTKGVYQEHGTCPRAEGSTRTFEIDRKCDGVDIHEDGHQSELCHRPDSRWPGQPGNDYLVPDRESFLRRGAAE